MTTDSRGRPIRVKVTPCPNCGRNDWWMLATKRERNFGLALTRDALQSSGRIVQTMGSMLVGMLGFKMFVSPPDFAPTDLQEGDIVCAVCFYSQR